MTRRSKIKRPGLVIKVVGAKLHIHGTYKGTQVRKTTGRHDTNDGWKVAEAMAKDIEDQIDAGTWGVEKLVVTWRMAFEHWETERKAKGEWNASNRGQGRRTLALFGADEDVLNLTDADMAGIVKQLEHRAGGTVNKHFNVAQSALAALARGKMITAGQLADLKAIFPPKAPDVQRTAHLDEEEVRALLAWAWKNCRPHYGAFAALVGLGARLGEVLRMERRHFKMATVIQDGRPVEMMVAKIIKPPQKKRNGKWMQDRTKTIERDIPVPGFLRAWVEDHAKAVDRDLMFNRATDNQPFATSDAASEVLNRNLKRGLRDIGSGWRLEPGAEGFRVHDLRHTYAFLQGAGGTPLEDLKGLMGHSKMDMTMRYRGFIMGNAVKGTAQAFRGINGPDAE